MGCCDCGWGDFRTLELYAMLLSSPLLLGDEQMDSKESSSTLSIPRALCLGVFLELI